MKKIMLILGLSTLSIVGFSQKLKRFSVDNKYGYMDVSGQEIIPPKYEDADPFYEGLAGVKLKGKWGFVDVSGKEVIPCKYERIAFFNEGRCLIIQGGKYGFINDKGKEIVPPKYDKASSFYEELALVSLNEKWGFIDLDGNVVIPINIIPEPTSFKNGMARISAYNPDFNSSERYLSGFIDKTGKTVIPPIYYGAEMFEKDCECVEVMVKGYKKVYLDYTGTPIEVKQMIAFSENRLYGYKDENGTQIVPPTYDHAWSFNELEMVGAVQRNGKEGFIDILGDEILPCVYDWIFPSVKKRDPSDWLAAEREGKYGMVNKYGEEVIACQYDAIGRETEGLIAVNKGATNYHNGSFYGGVWGFVDLQGNEVVPIQFEYSDPNSSAPCFKDGTAEVKLNGEWVYIDKKGNVVNTSDMAAIQKREAEEYKAYIAKVNAENEARRQVEAEVEAQRQANTPTEVNMNKAASVVIEKGYGKFIFSDGSSRKTFFGEIVYGELHPSGKEAVFTYENGSVEVININGDRTATPKGAIMNSSSKSNLVTHASWSGNYIQLTYQDGKVETVRRDGTRP